VKVYDNIMVGLLFCCLLAIIRVVNVSTAFVGVGYWFGPDSVVLDWEGYEEWVKEAGGGGGRAWISFISIIVL